MRLYPHALGGRSRGHGGDHGKIIHAVECAPDLLNRIPLYDRAACGKKPGRQSYGWDYQNDRAINCPACLKKMESNL